MVPLATTRSSHCSRSASTSRFVPVAHLEGHLRLGTRRSRRRVRDEDRAWRRGVARRRLSRGYDATAPGSKVPRARAAAELLQRDIGAEKENPYAASFLVQPWWRIRLGVVGCTGRAI